ncbi:hypothetical protein SPBR_03961 [Sporothrix brasiliensis 5110]|uniref:Protein prenyltransferase n=1 Tax=Sporothrix brasiliensis 5110 TaxID=1398154 RepID=A0A0C2F882_9PEZI|nr:uncharacterized protein SPBR_03961 [Sporothrix brasiliensis 5110]KIH95259.1 hypothetical protein SPBR_03961 [Sporothrix brasiliensis 5110]
MSRALDKATAAALQSGDPEAAFCAIADVLTETAEQQERLEIEFLGREHPPLPDGGYVLREGNAVAVPKLALVQAFIVARETLQKHRAATFLLPATDAVRTRILRATAVLLLMDPEHLTAANTRKRLILEDLLSASADAAADAPVASRASQLLADELHLIDSLLTSHLHRHTKSPTLWSHRRWLLLRLANPATDRTRLRRDVTHVVTVAAVRHPRNYYAWEHARWLVQWQSQGSRKSRNGTPETDEHDDEKLQLVVLVRDWCYRHHTDTSGWSFLFFLLASLPSSPRRTDAAPAQPSPLYEETVVQVEEMATSLRWTGEAVWVFLRTAVAYLEHFRRETGTTTSDASVATEEHSRLQAAASTLLATVDPTSHEHQILTRAQAWCATSTAGQTGTQSNAT